MSTLPEPHDDDGPLGEIEQGARGDSGGKQLTREALRDMEPDEILKAYRAGRLDKLLGRS